MSKIRKPALESKTGMELTFAANGMNIAQFFNGFEVEERNLSFGKIMQASLKLADGAEQREERKKKIIAALRKFLKSLER